jgi:hypothetical protein
MANFKGVSGITEIEAKVAKIIDNCFVNSTPEIFNKWAEENQVDFICWFSYYETKEKSDVVLSPFFHFSLLVEKHHSLRYLAMSKETAIRILTLGFAF